ncbi:MAG: dual specificity protein phosphatase family protein [Thermodesulfobacteriota bacterium]
MATRMSAMKYALPLIALSLLLFRVTIFRSVFDPASIFLLWTAVSFFLMGLGYAWLGPGVLGKKQDGRLGSLNRLLLFPYLLLSWSIWRIRGLTTAEPVAAEIIPGLWLGRRPYQRELPLGIKSVVDLAAEFPADRELVGTTNYISRPLLDGSTAGLGEFKKLIDEISRLPGPVYIHCAQGHGRSAMVMAGVLLSRGLTGTVEDVELLIKRARPKIRLNNKQKSLLRRYLEETAGYRNNPAGGARLQNPGQGAADQG